MNFSKALDQVTLSIKNEDKIATLNNLVTLYAFLPSYRSKISDDTISINIDFCKNCILNGYAFIEQNNWQETKNQLTNAVNYYSSVMESINTNVESQNRISKVFILLNELNNSIDLQDKEVFFIKYRNLMEEITNI